MIELRINGKSFQFNQPEDKPLLWVLRDDLGLTGTKYGCGVGVCGACIVHKNGTPIHACVTPLADLRQCEITTIEGLARTDHPVIDAWIAEQVPQCGYCQPAQIMAAVALLNRHPAPSEDRINEAMAPVLCRCGTYPRIRRALRRAAAHMQDTPPPMPQAAPAVFDTAPPNDEPFAPNPWLRVHRDNTVTIVIDRSEMGQGVVTSLAMLVADELDVDLDRVRTVFAPAAPAYVNAMIKTQGTGGSTSNRGAWQPLRRAGAGAREMLLRAAAQVWGVDPEECHTKHGTVVHPPSNRTLVYGALIDQVAGQCAPKKIATKSPDTWRYIGKSVARLEIPGMVRGETIYGLDILPPGRLVAMVARCPVFGGKLVDYDAAAARAVTGVLDVFAIDSGVAVVAEDFWSAQRGRDALAVTWDEGANATLDSAGIRRRFKQVLTRAGKIVRKAGSVKRALKRAAQTLEVTYETPYLAHAPLEPMNCTAQVRSDRCDVWIGTQAQGDTQQTGMQLTGLPAEAVHVHSTYLGGGFGRRWEQDFVAEAVNVAQHGDRPVQVAWTRQDDMQHDYYRPANLTQLTGALDADKKPLVWRQRIVGPELALEGIDIPYAIANLVEEYIHDDPGIPTGPWRSVGTSQNAFVVEGFIDELAHAAGRDPLAFRCELLAHSPRHVAVLRRAAAMAHWDSPLPARHGRGIAVYRAFGSWTAQVAEVALTTDGAIRVKRVTCAIDCGTVINPDTVAAQLEGGILFGLSAALYGEITIERGRVQQRSFEDYPIVTLANTPEIKIAILANGEPLGGVGEPGVPPIAPAVANAVFAATGKRLRRLPLRLTDGND